MSARTLRAAAGIADHPGVCHRRAVSHMRRGGSRNGRAGGGGGGPPPPPAMEIWLAIGDSETAGRAATGFDPGLVPTDGSVLTWDWTTSAFVTAEETNSRQAAGTSWTAIFGAYRQARVGGTVAVINAGQGSSTSDEWLPSSLVIYSGSTNLYTWALAAITQALSDNPGATFAGFLQYDGANDAALATPAWHTNWATTHAAFRAAIAGAASAPLIYSQLPDLTPTLGTIVTWGTVRSQQAGYASASNLMIEVSRWGSWRPSTEYGIHGEIVTNQVVAWQMDRRVAGLADSWPEAEIADYATNDLYPIPANLTLSGSEISELRDNVTGLALVQATSANRPTIVDPDAAFNGQPTILHGSNKWLQAAAGAVATHTYLHDGTGMSIVGLWDDEGSTADGVWINTVNGSATPGIWVRRNSTSIQINIYRAANVIYRQCPVTFAAPVGKTIVVIRFRLGKLEMRIGEAWAWTQGTFIGGAPVSTNHSPLKIGAQGALHFGGTTGRITMFNRFLTDFELFSIAKNYRDDYAVDF